VPWVVGYKMSEGSERMMDTNKTSAIVNRHMARLLSALEAAGCPDLFRDAVKSELVWMRADLTGSNERNERDDERGNR